jgi:hypothetical protein
MPAANKMIYSTHHEIHSLGRFRDCGLTSDLSLMLVKSLVMVLMGRTLDSAVMTMQAEK